MLGRLDCLTNTAMNGTLFLARQAWEHAPGPGVAEGVFCEGGASNACPRPHADSDTAQIQRCLSRRLHKGQKCDLGYAELV